MHVDISRREGGNRRQHKKACGNLENRTRHCRNLPPREVFVKVRIRSFLEPYEFAHTGNCSKMQTHDAN